MLLCRCAMIKPPCFFDVIFPSPESELLCLSPYANFVMSIHFPQASLPLGTTPLLGDIDGVNHVTLHLISGVVRVVTMANLIGSMLGT